MPVKTRSQTRNLSTRTTPIDTNKELKTEHKPNSIPTVPVSRRTRNAQHHINLVQMEEVINQGLLDDDAFQKLFENMCNCNKHKTSIAKDNILWAAKALLMLKWTT